MRIDLKKTMAIVLALAMLLVVIVVPSMHTVAEEEIVETVPSELYQNGVTVGETLIDVDFDEEGADFPSDWKYAKTFWVDKTAYINYGPKVENGALYLDSYMCDAIIAMPAINVADYVYEADLICAEVQGSFGLFNNMPSSTNIGVDASKACLNFVYSVDQQSQITYFQRGFGGDQVYVDDEGFTKPTTGTKVNMKIYCINGMNYFYVDGVLRAAYKQLVPQGASSIIGFYNCQGRYGIDKVTVKEIKLDVPEAVADIEAGETLYNLADDLAKTEVGAVPEGWIYGGTKVDGKALPWGFAGSSPSVGLSVVENSGVKALNFKSTNCDAVAVGPQILPSSYIYEVTFTPTKEASNMGISNATWGADSAGTIKSADWFVAKAGVNKDYYVSRNAKGLVSGAKETKLSYGYGDTLTANKEYTFKIICLDGTNYYFINDRYYGTHTPTSFITTYSDGTGGQLGLYTYSGNMNVSAMTVKAIKEEVVEEFLPEALENMGVTVGDSVLYEDFEKATAIPEGFELRNPVWDGWAVDPGSWELTNYTVNGKNDKGIKLTASQDDVILLPTIDTTNYVYEAEITLVNNINGSFGLLNDMSVKVRADGADSQGQSGDYGANRMVIYTMAHSSGKTNAYWVNRFGGQPAQTNIPKPAGLDTLPVTNTTLNFKVYTFEGMNFFYINDIYIATFANVKNFGPENVLGIFTSSAPIFVSKVSVKALNAPESNIGMADGKVYYKGEVVYDPDFSEFTVGSLPEGWTAGYNGGEGANGTSYGYTDTTTTSAMKPEHFVATVVEDATLGKVVKFQSGAADTYLSTPTTGTMNYMFEATIKVNKNGGSIGPANNYYATATKAGGALYSSLYVNSNSASIYTYRGGGTNGKWDISYNPTSGSEINFKVISLDGYNYIYYNNVLSAKMPWRNGGATATTDAAGFYTYNGAMLISDVTISEIYSVNTTVKNTFVTVDGDDVALSSKFEVNKNQPIYKDLIEGQYNSDSAIKFGAVVLKGDEKAFEKLTVDTEGAQILDGEGFTETDDALRFSVSLDVASADYQKWYSIRPFAVVDGNYFYGNGVAYKPVNLSNTAYYNADTEGKAEIKAVFGSYPEFIYGDKVNSITFTAYADLHYILNTYPATMSDVKQIFKRADDSNSAFIVSAGDMSNDIKGSPELINYFKGYVTEEGELLKAYNVYGNHELESGNSMADVTPTLTNDTNAVWGTADGKMDVNVGYYYADIDGFRLVAVDNSYDYNPNHYKNPDGSMGEVVGWEHYLTGSYGGTSAASNAKRGFYEGADAKANYNSGALGDVQTAWLESVLMDAAEKDIPCIVVGHAGYSGLGFGGGSYNSAEVRAIYKKANDANPGTVLMSINGHIHTNNQGWNEGVFYLDLNTVRNAWWQSASVAHYGANHTYEFENYDANGNYIGTTTKKLSDLRMAGNTWFSADPLSAVITLSDNGVVEINGTESEWIYGVEPDLKSAPAGSEPRITSGLFIDCDIYGHALTCVEDGDGHYHKCANPKCDYVEDKVAHVFDKEVATDDYKASDADCQNSATYYKSCVCGAEGTETFSAGTLGDHKIVDGSCTVCENVLGDLSGDKVVDIFDLVKINRIIKGLDGANAFADVDQNGKINAADMALIRTMIIK